MALILVADDEPLALQAYRAKLVEGGHDVSVALRAGDAWEVLHRRPVDLLICDLSMPDGGGADLIRVVRANPAWAKISVIVASASPLWHAKTLVHGLGVRAILTKSHFSLAQLLVRVNAVLRNETADDAPADAAAPGARGEGRFVVPPAAKLPPPLPVRRPSAVVPEDPLPAGPRVVLTTEAKPEAKAPVAVVAGPANLPDAAAPGPVSVPAGAGALGMLSMGRGYAER